VGIETAAFGVDDGRRAHMDHTLRPGKADPATDFLYACLHFWKALAKIRILATLIQRIGVTSDAQNALTLLISRGAANTLT
jgi:hypothetical protein